MNRKAPGIATALLVLLALLALAAGCSSPSSGGGAPAAGGSATLPSAVAYSHCVRTHGVPRFPDPGSNGQVPKAGPQQLGVSGSQLQAAQHDCQHLYPSNGGSVQQEEQGCYVASDCPAALTRRMMTAALRFSRCMRAHAVPNFPDPTDSQGSVFFNTSAHGISDAMSHTPQFIGKLNTCQRQAGNFPFAMG
jgi:hypothetical protein